jgi:hypothetical protein
MVCVVTVIQEMLGTNNLVEVNGMGLLYNSVKLKNNMKKEMVMERLHELGVKEYQGKAIHDIEYRELLTVLVLAEMRQEDIEHPDHKWFR